MKNPLLTTVFLLAALFCTAQSGSITVTSVSQRADGSGFVDIYFNLSGPASAYNISMQASFDGGSNYNPIPPAFLSGDIAGITPGSNKHIVWDGLGSFPNTFSTQARLELTATEVVGGGTPCPGMPTFTDPRDGQTYNTVQIGSQCWMKENLNYTTANSWCYANNTANCTNYGRLYTWQAALTACPPGWHLPSHFEWTQLEQYVCNALGNSGCEIQFPYDYTAWGWRGTNEGNALKSCRQVNSPLGGDCNTTVHPRWDSHGTHHGFDEYGFSALPGGRRNTYGSFYYIGLTGYWWSSTETSSAYAWGRGMYYRYGSVYRTSSDKARGFSARCLRD
jgi:uncharacterized protein (TIGR02145 family)